MATPTPYQKITDWNTEFLAAFPSHALYQDSAGTLAVKALEDPVGLVLDKKNGLVLGAELVVNGDFSNGDTGWNKTDASITISGGACHFAATPAVNTLNQSITVSGTKSFLVTFTISNYVAGAVRFDNSVVGAVSGDISGNGEKRVFFTSSTCLIYFEARGTSTFDLDNISVREIPGTHLLQSTSGNRPTWTRRVNILNATATLSIQTATTIAAQYKLSFTGAGSIALSGTATGTITAGTTLVTCTAGTLTLTVTGAVTLADMRLSSDVATPTYQAVRSATDYDYVGFPSKIKHNGTNSFLYTASTMNLSATDKVTVFAGVQKLGSTQQFIAEIGPATESNNGSFAVYADDRASKTYAFWTRGTTGIFPFTGSYTPPITNVYSAQSSISTPSVKIRINGVQDGTSTASQGTGNYGNYVMTVGARTGPVFPFSGSWTQLIIRGALTSDAQVAQAETYVRNKTLAYPYYGYYGYPGQIGIDWTVGVSTLS